VEVARPDEELQWQKFSSSSRIAWKTGTSFGNRDAWSIGVTPDFVVAVWVGNASGEGRPALTGINVAAPILFDIFKCLPQGRWFREPKGEMVRVAVCRYSGYRSSPVCEIVDSAWIQKNGAKTAPCPFHKLVHLDRTGKYQVNANCESQENMQHLSWFVLPPVQEWYFRNRNPFYKQLPPFRSDCAASSETRNMEMIYPKNNSIIYIPIDLDGTPGETVFKLAHRNGKTTVYWHLDDSFIGSTVQTHQWSISAPRGKHYLTLIDEIGETLKIGFEVLTKE
jgi:penicillin-binding protein 1C